tara:strand:- start:516348 stop:517367 length:1020 start_codon:yes stop_codon:yes gene_type:complete
MTSKIDLTFVEPHQREEIRRRIKAVQRFNLAPGRAKAAEEAAGLGLGVASFYRIVKAWNAKKDPTAIQGARTKPRGSKLALEQKEIIKAAVSEQDDTEAIVKQAFEMGEGQDVEMPSEPAVREFILELRRGKFDLIPPSVTHVVDHCHLNLPLEDGRGGATKAVSTVIVDMRNGRVAGAALGREAPSASRTAAALIDAARRTVLIGPSARLLIDRESTADWLELDRSLSQAGIVITGDLLTKGALEEDTGSLRKRGNGRTMIAVAGRYVAGYRVSVRTFGDHCIPVRLRSGAVPMSPLDAQKLVRDRLDREAMEGGWFRGNAEARKLAELLASVEGAIN